MNKKEKTGFGWPHDVTKKDLRIEFFRGSGPGGQNKNKRDTACRITHIPTGLVAQAQEHTTQDKNKKAAFKRLCDQLVPIMKKETQKKRRSSPDTKVRTYHEKDNRVTDHGTNLQFSYDEFMDGEKLDIIIDELIMENKKIDN